MMPSQSNSPAQIGLTPATLGELLGAEERKMLMIKFAESPETPAPSTLVRHLTVENLRHIINIIATPPFKNCLPAQAISILYRRAGEHNRGI